MRPMRTVPAVCEELGPTITVPQNIKQVHEAFPSAYLPITR